MKILDYIKSNLVLLDGGMGTLLQTGGLRAGELPERLNLTNPSLIEGIHRRYFEAGSNIVCTNTFGANILKFDENELESIVQAAITSARNAADGKDLRWVALDIGPTGRMLAPYGDLDFEDAVSIFAKTVQLGVKYGADLIYIETMSDSYETKAALLAAKENSSLPVFVSNAYGEDEKLLTGTTPRAMVSMLEGLGADAIGINCSQGPDVLSPVLAEYKKYSSLPLIFKPNAGLPSSRDGRTVYDIEADEFAKSVAALVCDGVRAVGGCCGTTPEYIAALKRESDKLCISTLNTEKKPITSVSSHADALIFGERAVLIGERINPTGKPKLKEALRRGDIEYILGEGLSEEAAGVPVLDVNVGLPDIDEVNMLVRAVCELQAVVSTPLQIDTTNVTAMEAALRRYNGKAMINSVNAKSESMSQIFPLAKKYGGLIVALTLDEEGIPATAEGRLAIAKRILCEAEKYGIDKRDIIFDPLAMTVSADKDSALTALKAVQLIHTHLGAHTSLGVSNISFGLPCRDILNGTFFAMALREGLSAAIINPFSRELMNAYHAYNVLSALDENCADYIEYSSSLPSLEQSARAEALQMQSSEAEAHSPLTDAIIKGRKALAGELTRELLKANEPLSLVENEIIPALNEVGVAFEAKRAFLPQLLMSAEAAQSAFAEIKAALPTGASSKSFCVILATVKGDIHDIGKNIVRLLLENYGFDVYDMGRDVPPRAIADKALELHAPLVGLSALMTTTVPAMQETIALLHELAPWCKTVVGGAVLTAEYAEKIGADRYSKDAMETVRYAEQLLHN